MIEETAAGVPVAVFVCWILFNISVSFLFVNQSLDLISTM